jgi:hypothetical protein
MYMGSWQTRVQVPNAAAFTFPPVHRVISARHELGAKMLSHHSGLTSILVVSQSTWRRLRRQHRILRIAATTPRRLVGDVVLGIGCRPFDARVIPETRATISGV